MGHTPRSCLLGLLATAAWGHACAAPDRSETGAPAGGEGEGEGQAAEGEGEGEQAAEGEGEGEPTPGCTEPALSTVGDIEVFTYEASRPGAGPASPGAGIGPACSAAGVLPWTDLAVDDAARACQVAGFRLCTLDEWRRACSGPQQLLEPYGHAFEQGTCNDHHGEDEALEPTGSRPGCESPEGPLDMVGNAWEWVSDVGDEGQSISTGWSYLAPQGNPGAEPSCHFRFKHRFDGYKVPDLGFRCCR